MAKRAVCVLNGDVKGTIFFDQEVGERVVMIRPVVFEKIAIK